jgi:hypothetical protein
VVIQSEQKNALAQDALRRANEALAAYARRRFPSLFEKTAQEVLLKMVQEIRTRAGAGAGGFDREDHIATYLDLTVMYGSDFPESNWAKPILTSPSLSPEHKISALTSQVEETGVKL